MFKMKKMYNTATKKKKKQFCYVYIIFNDVRLNGNKYI